jgi:hypothetical protein
MLSKSNSSLNNRSQHPSKQKYHRLYYNRNPFRNLKNRNPLKSKVNVLLLNKNLNPKSNMNLHNLRSNNHQPKSNNPNNSKHSNSNHSSTERLNSLRIKMLKLKRKITVIEIVNSSSSLRVMNQNMIF